MDRMIGVVKRGLGKSSRGQLGLELKTVAVEIENINNSLIFMADLDTYSDARIL